MGNLTPDQQRKVDEILLEAKGLYVAILASEPPASLGLAIRDKKPWDKLAEPEITALFKVIVAIRKAATDGITAPAQASSAAGETGNGEPAKPATVADSPPEKVASERGEKPPKKGGLTASAT